MGIVVSEMVTWLQGAPCNHHHPGRSRSHPQTSEPHLVASLPSSPQLSKPEKVSIPERYVDLDPEEPLTLEELQARYRKAEKIRNILARSRWAGSGLP